MGERKSKSDGEIAGLNLKDERLINQYILPFCVAFFLSSVQSIPSVFKWTFTAFCSLEDEVGKGRRPVTLFIGM